MCCSKEGHRSELDELTSRCAVESVGSIDRAVNARAIATASPDVRLRIEEALSKGNRLQGIVPVTGYGSSPLDYRLRFEFASTGSDATSDADFQVSVELPTLSVRRIIDPSNAPGPAGPSAIAAPLSIAVATDAGEYKARAVEATDRHV